MISITLPLPIRRVALLRRSSLLGALLSRHPADWIAPPAELQHPPSLRAQRLMRAARAGD